MGGAICVHPKGIRLTYVVYITCATRLGDFTVISTKNIEWSRANEYVKTAKDVNGSDTIHVFLLFIQTKSSLDLKEAIDNALDKIPGAVAITDAVIYYNYFDLLYFYGQRSISIKGKILIDPKIANSLSQAPEGKKNVVLTSNDGKNFETKYVTEAEFNLL